MTRPLRARLLLAVLAGLLLTTFVVGPADARLPRARHYRVGGHISLDTNLLSTSGLSAWAIDEYLAANTSLPPLGAAFMAAERKYGINARFLLAAAMHESGWGTGAIARVKHNLFGYNAYDRNPFKFANAYATYAANINDTARFMKDFYLTPSGRWWGGRPTLRSMQQYWSSSGRWGVLVGRIATSLHLDTLRHRGIRFAAPRVGGSVHHGATTSVGLAWSGGALPATLPFVAAWEPVELDSDVAAAAALMATDGVPAVGDAAYAPPSADPTGRPSTLGNPAASGETIVAARRTRSGAHAVILALPTPRAPGRYVLHLALRDAGGGPLPAVDRIPIPAIAVRVWADRAVSYSIVPGADGAGAVVRITNTGRTTIPATDGRPVSVSTNPEVEPPETTITVTSTTDAAAGSVLSAIPLRADLPPGGSVTLSVPGVDPAEIAVSVSVLGDASWLGVTSTNDPATGLQTDGSTPPAIATPSPSPTPAPTPTPPAPAPKPAPKPPAAPHRHVTTIVTERSGAIHYRGRWGDASGGGYLGGRVAWSSTPGATATLTFTGTSVAWIGPVGPTRGRAAVVLDGRVVARISLWRSSFGPRAVLYRRSFATVGRHTLRIVVLSAAGHPVVAIDGFLVRS